MLSLRPGCTAVLALAVIPISTHVALGQEPSLGERVRVTTGSDAPVVVGVFETREPDHFLLKTSGPVPVRITWDEVSRLQVSRGTKSNAGKGALIGGAIGLGASGLVMIVGCSNSDGACSGEEGAVAAWVGISTGLGALVGTAIGAAARSEKWVDVPPDRWRIEVAPDPTGGVAVGLNLRL